MSQFFYVLEALHLRLKIYFKHQEWNSSTFHCDCSGYEHSFVLGGGGQLNPKHLPLNFMVVFVIRTTCLITESRYVRFSSSVHSQSISASHAVFCGSYLAQYTSPCFGFQFINGFCRRFCSLNPSYCSETQPQRRGWPNTCGAWQRRTQEFESIVKWM